MINKPKMRKRRREGSPLREFAAAPDVVSSSTRILRLEAPLIPSDLSVEGRSQTSNETPILHEKEHQVSMRLPIAFRPPEHACVVCCDGPPSVAYGECGHYCVCLICLQGIQRNETEGTGWSDARRVRCPLCRRESEWVHVRATIKQCMEMKVEERSSVAGWLGALVSMFRCNTADSDVNDDMTMLMAVAF